MHASERDANYHCSSYLNFCHEPSKHLNLNLNLNLNP